MDAIPREPTVHLSTSTRELTRTQLALAEDLRHDAPRIGALDHKMGYAMGEGIGFPRAGSGDHQERRRRGTRLGSVKHGAPLLGVEGVEIGGGGGWQTNQSRKTCKEVSTFPVLFATLGQAAAASG